MKKLIALVLFTALLFTISCNNQQATNNYFPALSGPYLGQDPPDSIPEIFAPGIIGTGMFTRDIAMPPSGDEIYFCVALGNYTFATILYSKLENGKWTKPEVVPFAADGKIIDFEPAFSPDGNRLYFLSARADGEEEAGDQDIWYSDRIPGGWSEPVNPGEPLNTDGGEFFPSPTQDGFLYFTHNDKGNALNQIFRSKILSDGFGEAELLPEEVNCGTNRFNAFVSPDHSYVIVPAVGMEDAYDQVDYYITFRKDNDTWSTPINMGAAINENNTRGWSPYVSPDGKYFFFMTNRSEDIEASDLSYEKLVDINNSPGNGNSYICWMTADFIGELEKIAIFKE